MSKIYSQDSDGMQERGEGRHAGPPGSTTEKR